MAMVRERRRVGTKNGRWITLDRESTVQEGARRRRNDGYDVGRRDDTETPVVETRVSRRAPKAPRGGQVRHPKQLLIVSVLAY